MARLPDLVRDSQLKVKFCDGRTTYVNFEADFSSEQRADPRDETWEEGRQFGSGAFGSVCKEICIDGDRKGAVRCVKKIFVGQKDFRDVVYIRELEAIAKFSHPKYVRRFVKSFGWYKKPETLCIVMEYCQLGDLQAYLSSASRLSESQAQVITFQILEGLHYMHENEFAHRDLKPSNILIMSQPPNQWWIKIADFGISKRVDESLGMPSTMKGTLQFMAPELLGPDANGPTNDTPTSFDPYAADMWSLGAVSFQVLTKQPAFPGVAQIFYAKGLQPFPNHVLAQCDVSKSGQNFISSSMHLSPDNRLTAAQGLEHEWMKRSGFSYTNTSAVKSACSSTPLATEQLDSTELSVIDDINTLPRVQSVSENLATWSTMLEQRQEAQHLTKPSAANQDDQKCDKLRTKAPRTVEIDSSMGTITAAPNVEQSYPSRISGRILESQTPNSSTIDSGLKTSTALSKLAQSLDLLRLHHEQKKQVQVQNGYFLQQRFKGKSKVIGEVRAVGFLQDSNPIAVSWIDNDIMLWDLGPDSKPSLKVPVNLFRGHDCWFGAKIAISPDGKLLASGSLDGTIHLWDLGLGQGSKVLHTPKGSNPGNNIRTWVNDIIFSPDGKVVASCSQDGYLNLWRTDSGTLLRTFSRNYERSNRHIYPGDSARRNFVNRPLFSVAFHPYADLVACSCYLDIQLWNSTSDERKPLRIFETLKENDDNGNNSLVSSLIFSLDGRLLVSGLKDGRIRIWDAYSGLLLRTAKKHNTGINALAFSKDGKLASSSTDGTIKLWDLRSGLDLDEPLQTIKGFNSKKTYQSDSLLAFSTDGRRLMSGSQDVCTVSIWGLWPN